MKIIFSLPEVKNREKDNKISTMETVKGPWTKVKNTTPGFHYLNSKKL